MEKICVYCGSSDKIDDIYLEQAYEFGKLMAERGHSLVYGAGSTGLMGKVADGVLDHNGEVFGVIPEMFNTPALMHTGLTSLEITPDIQSRKARMAELADGFVALPGGYGTMEELFEILTWAQIGLHQKPVSMLNINGFYDQLNGFINQMLLKGFIYDNHMLLFKISSNPVEILDFLNQYELPEGLSQWVDRD